MRVLSANVRRHGSLEKEYDPAHLNRFAHKMREIVPADVIIDLDIIPGSYDYKEYSTADKARLKHAVTCLRKPDGIGMALGQLRGIKCDLYHSRRLVDRSIERLEELK